MAVTCGAGINCVAVAPDGREARFPALGPVTGDWGGGEGLGREALWWAVRDEDGRGPRTMLREAVAAYFGMPTASDVGIGIHYGKIPEDELLGLAPVLLRRRPAATRWRAKWSPGLPTRSWPWRSR